MALGWDLAAQRGLAGDDVRPVILFRMATSPVVRIWSGIGPFQIGSDTIETTDDAEYAGLGELLPTPELNALVNGLAERIDFTLSGVAVTPEVVAIAATEAADIRAAVVNIGFLILGPDLQQLSPTAWLWDGTADVLKIDRSSGDGGIAVRSLTLSVGSVLTGRKKPARSYWSDADQRRRSADDDGLKQIKRYNAGTTKTWPI